MVQYIVNEEKKIVIAILKTVNAETGENITSTDAFRKLYKIVGHKNFTPETHPYLLMQNYYMARATCDEQDEFDVEVGKRIALERAKKKYFAALDRRMINYYNSLKREVGMIYDFFHREKEEKKDAN